MQFELQFETVPFWLTVFPWRRQKLAVQAKIKASGVKCYSTSAYRKAKKKSCQLMVFWYPMASHSLHWARAVFMHLRQALPREAADKCFGVVQGRNSSMSSVASVKTSGISTLDPI